MYTFEVIFLKQFHRAEYVLYSVHHWALHLGRDRAGIDRQFFDISR